MKRSAAIALFVLMACGSGKDQDSAGGSAPADAPKRPVSELFVWSDASAAQGNLEGDYADCKAQIEKDPAIGQNPQGLVELNAYIQCMTPKGWKFVNPDAPQP